MSFTSIKNTGNDFPLCLSSAQHSSLGGGAVIWEEIIKELVLSDSEGSSAQRRILTYICRDTEVPQLWWQQLECHNGMRAVFEWDTMGLGAGLRATRPLGGSSSSSTHQTSSSAEKRAATSHSRKQACGVLIA